ncbi:MAG: hypothetical protein Q4D02_06125 [Clostridia bacterium]|nr:hypothetical protein [Clostridia bacterium]
MRYNYDDMKGQVVRIKKQQVYYFDKDGIYQCMPLEEAKKIGFPNLYTRFDGSVYFFKPWHGTDDNGNLIKMVICKLEIGDNIKTFLDNLSHSKLEKHDKPEGIERFIARIEEPTFYRVPENLKENTFDYIYVDINLLTNWNQDRKKYIKENIDEINQRVIEKIKNQRSFIKYGISINFLKISRITLSERQNLLQYVFELKK